MRSHQGVDRRVNGVEVPSVEHDGCDPGPLPQLPYRRLRTRDSEPEASLVVELRGEVDQGIGAVRVGQRDGVGIEDDRFEEARMPC